MFLLSFSNNVTGKEITNIQWNKSVAKDKKLKKFRETEGPAAEIFMYKWGIPPRLFENLSHNPKDNKVVKGIKYE